MPKLPVLSGSEVIRRLGRLGFEQVRQRGSHVVCRRGDAGCVVPLHKEVKTGTLAGIFTSGRIEPGRVSGGEQVSDTDRIIAPVRKAEDVDAALRSKHLDEFVGQRAAVAALRPMLEKVMAK